LLYILQPFMYHYFNFRSDHSRFSAIISSTLKMCASSDCSCFEKNVEKLL